MKILFYNHTGAVSGAEYLLLMILARLDRSEFTPLVICPADGPLVGKVKAAAVPVETVTGLSARFTLRPDYLLCYLRSFFHVIRDVRQKVLAYEPDLIHANSIRAGLVATAATLDLQTKVVWHLHDLLPRHPISTLIRALACLSLRSRMIAVSQSVADNFTGAFSPLRRRVHVILNGIDLERFQPGVATREQLRSTFKIHTNDFVVGIVGQLTPRKGQLELVQAFARVLEKLPQAVLMIVGAPLFNRDQDYADSLAQTARELGIAAHVRLTGSRSDIAAVMQAIDLLVVNSTVEPFGLVALEAMACARPVLAAISGGIPELIKQGETGWLVPQGNQEALAKAIINLAADSELREQLGTAGQQRVTSRFSAERYQVDLHQFYFTVGRAASEVAAARNKHTEEHSLPDLAPARSK